MHGLCQDRRRCRRVFNFFSFNCLSRISHSLCFPFEGFPFIKHCWCSHEKTNLQRRHNIKQHQKNIRVSFPAHKTQKNTQQKENFVGIYVKNKTH